MSRARHRKQSSKIERTRLTWRMWMSGRRRGPVLILLVLTALLAALTLWRLQSHQVSPQHGYGACPREYLLHSDEAIGYAICHKLMAGPFVGEGKGGWPSPFCRSTRGDSSNDAGSAGVMPGWMLL